MTNMRAIRKTGITFGMVNVPVKVFSALEETGIECHQLHGQDLGRIRYQKVCQCCGEVVAQSDIDKGYVTDDGDLVVLTEQELDELGKADPAVEVLQFVDKSEIDPMSFERSYFLAPETKGSVKGYQLLARVLEATDRMAIVHITLRTRTRLGALRVRQYGKQKVLVVQTMLWPEEMRQPQFDLLDEAAVVTDREIAAANALVESMAEPFRPADHQDVAQVGLRELVAAKQAMQADEGSPVAAIAEDGHQEKAVGELMAKLAASLEAKQQAKLEATPPTPNASSPRKRAAAKKAPAKKAPAKRTTTTRRKAAG